MQTSQQSISFTYDRWEALLQSLLRQQGLSTATRTSGSRYAGEGSCIDRDASNAFNVDTRRSRSRKDSQINDVIQQQNKLQVEDTQGVKTHSRSRSAPPSRPQSSSSNPRTRDRDDSKATICEDNGSGNHQCLASILTLRGQDAQLACRKDTSNLSSTPSPLTSSERKRTVSKHINNLNQNSDYVLKNILETLESYHSKWATANAPVCVTYSNSTCNGYQRSASILSNGQSILPILQRSLHKASQLFHANAYIHQYESCDITKQDFIESFHRLGQVVQNYKSLY